MTEEYLFVYGTLRRDAGHPMFQWLARYATLVGEATYQGRLYLVKTYPGVVPSDDPTDRVCGEVYRLHQPASIFPELDQYEECGPAFPPPAQYVRERQQVMLNNGATITTWVYLYNRPTDNLSLIPSGDFLEFKSEDPRRSSSGGSR